jgi:hypothetical protein
MNTFRKDGTANWNVALGRSFRLPGVQLAVATFGNITNTVNKGRQVQFTLKLNF